MAAHHQRRSGTLVHPHTLAISRIQSSDTSVAATHHDHTIRHLRHAQYFAGYQALPFQFAGFVVSPYLAFVATDEHQPVAAGYAAANHNASLNAPTLFAGGTLQARQTALGRSAVNRICGECRGK